MDLESIKSKNFYEVLGLEPDATPDRIKEVYKDLAKVYHPDSNFYAEIVPEKASNEEVQIFKIITAAYNTLADDSKRAEYDKIIAPIIALNSKVRSWEDNSAEEFTKSGSHKIKAHSGVFGKSEFRGHIFDDNTHKSKVIIDDEDSIPQRVNPVSSLAVGLGLFGGVLAGAAVCYLLFFH